MIQLLTIIVLTVIWNLGIEIVLSEGMALHKIRLWAESKSGKWIEPLITCVWCRPSIHSIIGVLASFGLGLVEWETWNIIILYPFVVAGTSFISGTLWSLYKFIEIKHKYYTHLEQQEYFNLKDRKFKFKNKN